MSETDSLMLATVLRLQPASARKICTAFSRSSGAARTLRNIDGNHSIAKLKDRGLIEVVSDGRRGEIERLACTDAGKASARGWIFDFTTALPQDPLSLRFFALPVLGLADRRAWVAGAKQAVLQTLADTENAAQANADAHLNLIYDNARLASLARIRWLERVEAKLDTLTMGPAAQG